MKMYYIKFINWVSFACVRSRAFVDRIRFFFFFSFSCSFHFGEPLSVSFHVSMRLCGAPESVPDYPGMCCATSSQIGSATVCEGIENTRLHRMRSHAAQSIANYI